MKKIYLVMAGAVFIFFMVINLSVLAEEKSIGTNGNIEMLDGSNLSFYVGDIQYLQSEINRLLNETAD